MQSVLWMIGAIASFSLMAVGARELSAHLDTFEVLTLRSLIGLIIVMAIIYWRGQPELFVTQRTHAHLGRNLFHFYGQASWFFAIGMIPLAQVFALEFTVPIWVLVIAAVFLAEPITLRKLVAVGLGMAGVLLIVRPGAGTLSTGMLVMLFGAIGFAVAIVFNKKLVSTEHPLTIVFYMSLMQLPINAILTGGDWTMPEDWMWVWLLVIGGAGISAHFCASKAMQTVEVSSIMAMDFLRLPVIALVGMLLYGELFDWWVIVGGGLMIIGNMIGQGLWRKHNLI
ncbi:MAG: DMT family transporter [Gammaproteobacteria bacterium]|jgi:drug/metabolite transporter (DMT)-like permease|nr:DMT family transporter [Gammaproteobacteria bacterium]